jgi:hypothetical protein
VSPACPAPCRARALRKVTAYVPQKDVLLPTLTVEESLRYSALLRLPKTLTAQQVGPRQAAPASWPLPPARTDNAPIPPPSAPA